jgi:predicted enzyme related to lactoylglutathione lyase
MVGMAMERVTGIGGFFFKAARPEELGRWYSTHLGVEPPPDSYAVSSWWQQAGPTVVAAMPAGSEHFGASGSSWSINFRVADLAAMVAQLRAADIEVEVDPETYPNGSFAGLRDPEGNVVQLWEPAGADLRGPGAAPA